MVQACKSHVQSILRQKDVRTDIKLVYTGYGYGTQFTA
jgi:hypothetical protein